MEIIVGLGDLAVSGGSGDIIKTFALASCVGITVYCARSRIAGMVHIVLPECPERAAVCEKPGYYADRAVPRLLEAMYAKGCGKHELNISLFGGANSKNPADCFNIGMRNLQAARKLLDCAGVAYRLCDVGGNSSRTLIMDVATGGVRVNTLPMLF